MTPPKFRWVVLQCIWPIKLLHIPFMGRTESQSTTGQKFRSVDGSALLPKLIAFFSEVAVYYPAPARDEVLFLSDFFVCFFVSKIARKRLDRFA